MMDDQGQGHDQPPGGVTVKVAEELPQVTMPHQVETHQQVVNVTTAAGEVPMVTGTDITSTLASFLPRASDLSVSALALQLSSQLSGLPGLSAHLPDLGLSQPGMSRHLPPLSSLSGLHGRSASVPPMMSTAHPDIMATLTNQTDPGAFSATLPVTSMSHYIPVTDTTLNMAVTAGSLQSLTNPMQTVSASLPFSSAYATSLAAIQAGLVVSVPGVSAPPLPPSAQQGVTDSPVMSETSSVHDTQVFPDNFAEDPDLKTDAASDIAVGEEARTKTVQQQQHKVEILPPKKADAFRNIVTTDDPGSPYVYQKQMSVQAAPQANTTGVEYQQTQARQVVTDGDFSAHGSPAVDADFQQRAATDADFQHQRAVVDYTQQKVVGVTEYQRSVADTQYVYHTVQAEGDYVAPQSRTEGVEPTQQYEDRGVSVEVATDYSNRRLVAEDYSMLRTNQVGEAFTQHTQPRATAVLESEFRQQQAAAIQRELAQQQRAAVEEYHRQRAAAAAILESELHTHQRTALEAEYPNQRLAVLDTELQHQRAVSQLEAELHHQRALADAALQRVDGDFSHPREASALDFTQQRTLEEEFQQRATPGGSIDFSQGMTREAQLASQRVEPQTTTYQHVTQQDVQLTTAEYHQRLAAMDVTYDGQVIDGRAALTPQAHSGQYTGQEEVVTTDVHGTRHTLLPAVSVQDATLQMQQHHMPPQTVALDATKDATEVMRDDEEKSIAAILLDDLYKQGGLADAAVGVTSAVTTASLEQEDDDSELTPAQRSLLKTRSIQTHWFMYFPWLVLSDSSFYCRYCLEVGNDSIFCKGRPADNPKKDYFAKHEQTDVHREAMRKLGMLPIAQQALQAGQTSAGSSTAASTEGSITASTTETLETPIPNRPQLSADMITTPGQEGAPSLIDSNNCSALRYIHLEKRGMENRAIHERWFLDFPWLLFDLQKNMFFCKVCQRAKADSQYATGVPATNPKKSNFSNHEKTTPHKQSMKKLDFMTVPESTETPGSIAEPGQAVTISSEAELASENQEPTEEDSDPKGVRRKIRREWFVDFQWLKLDHSTQCFYCVLCRRFQQPGVFTTGKSLSNPKKDNFAKHEETEGHKIAALRDMGMSEEEAWNVLKKDGVITVEGAEDVTATNKSKKPGTDDVKPLSVLEEPSSCQEGSLAPISAQDFLAFCAERRGPSHRRIQLEWFLEYPWLEVDRKRKVFLCKYCRVYRPLGVFVAGKPIEDPKQDDLRKHEETEGHKEAVKSYDKDTNVATRPDLKGSSIGVVDAAMVLSYTSSLPVSSSSSQVRSTLMMQYPWLQHNADTDVYFCLPCRDCTWQPQGGEPSTTIHVWSGPIKKNALENHEVSKIHKQSIERFREIQKSVVDETQQTPPAVEKEPGLVTWREAFWDFAHQLRQLGLLCDVTLTVQMEGTAEKSFQAHKLMLVCASDYFKACLRENALENQYIIDNITPKGMEGVLNFLYGQVQGIEPDNYKDCLHAANVLMFPKAQDYFQKLIASLKPPVEPEPVPPMEAPPIVVPESTPPPTSTTPTKAAVKSPAESQETPVAGAPKRKRGRPPKKRLTDTPPPPAEQAGQDTSAAELPPPEKVKVVESKSKSKAAIKPALPPQPPKMRTRSADQSKLPVADVSDPVTPQAEMTENIAPPIDNGAVTLDNDEEDNMEDDDDYDIDEDALAIAEDVEDDDEDDDDDEDVDDEDMDSVNGDDEEWEVPSSLKMKDQLVQGGKTVPEKSIPKSEYASDRKQKLGKYLPTCDICGKKFLRKGCIQKHKERQHANNQVRAEFPCDMCSKVCHTKHDLKLHKRIHTGERPYLCGECGKSFTRKETLIEHEYTHKPDAEKPHRCSECGKGFFKIYDLQRHFTGIHSGKKPFQCHLCGKSFPWARSLRDHIQAHQGAGRSRPYKCKDCDMTFVRKYDLNRHAITHSKEKPYVCEFCGHGFTQKGSMDKHKRDFCRGRPGDYKHITNPPGRRPNSELMPAGKNKKQKQKQLKVEHFEQYEQQNQQEESTDGFVPIPAPSQDTLDPSQNLIFYSV